MRIDAATVEGEVLERMADIAIVVAPEILPARYERRDDVRQAVHFLCQVVETIAVLTRIVAARIRLVLRLCLASDHIMLLGVVGLCGLCRRGPGR